MKRYQEDAFAALCRVLEFCESRRAEIDEPGFGAQLDALADRVQRIESLAVRQVTQRGRAAGALDAEQALRLQLRRRHLAPLRQVAKAIALDVPGFDELFRVPHVTVPTQELLGSARAMEDLATQHEAVFIAAGHPEGFLRGLREAIDALVAKRAELDQSKGSRVGATAGLQSDLKRGRAIASVLDTIIRRRYEGDIGTLTAWRSAKRIQRKPGPAKGSTRRSAALPEAPLLSTVVHSDVAPPGGLVAAAERALVRSPTRPQLSEEQ